MWFSVLGLIASVVMVVYVSRELDAPPPRKTLIVTVLFIIGLRAVFYIAFRLFDVRDVSLHPAARCGADRDRLRQPRRVEADGRKGSIAEDPSLFHPHVRRT